MARSTHGPDNTKPRRAGARLSRDIACVRPDMKLGKMEPGNDYHGSDISDGSGDNCCWALSVLIIYRVNLCNMLVFSLLALSTVQCPGTDLDTTPTQTPPTPTPACAGPDKAAKAENWEQGEKVLNTSCELLTRSRVALPIE